MGSLYLGGPTIQEMDGKMMMGLSIYGVAVISRSLYSRFYGILTIIINFPYSTCISSFFGNSIPTSLFIFKMFFRSCF